MKNIELAEAMEKEITVTSEALRFRGKLSWVTGTILIVVA